MTRGRHATDANDRIWQALVKASESSARLAIKRRTSSMNHDPEMTRVFTMLYSRARKHGMRVSTSWFDGVRYFRLESAQTASTVDGQHA